MGSAVGRGEEQGGRSILGAWASCWRLGLQSVPEGDLQSWSPQESSHPPRGRQLKENEDASTVGLAQAEP